jgi:hypothetical protein
MAEGLVGQMDSISDSYMKKINKHWHEITGMYLAFENKKPIIEFEPNRIRIIAYPAEEYIEGLSDRTRDQSRKQYREASVTGALMVFVRDEQKEILRSYIFPRAEEE